MLFTSTMPTHADAEKNRGRRVLFPLKRANTAAFGLYDRAAGQWLAPSSWSECLVPPRERERIRPAHARLVTHPTRTNTEYHCSCSMQAHAGEGGVWYADRVCRARPPRAAHHDARNFLGRHLILSCGRSSHLKYGFCCRNLSSSLD
jgi:hypothetical protein